MELINTALTNLSPPLSTLDQNTELLRQISQAGISSTHTTLIADGQLDAIIQYQGSMQSWQIDSDLTDSSNAALGSILGSAATLNRLVQNNAGLSDNNVTVTTHSNGTTTITATQTHNPGLAQIMAEFAEKSSDPAQSSADNLASLLTQRGNTVANSMADFSAHLPLKALEFVQAGVASSALGTALTINSATIY